LKLHFLAVQNGLAVEFDAWRVLIPKILSVYPPVHPIGRDVFAGFADLIIASAPLEDVLIAEGKGALGIIARGPARIGAKTFDQLPSVAFAFTTGSGADCFDVEAATERGIPVINNAGVASATVAEYVVGVIVVAMRALGHAERRLRAEASWEPEIRFRGLDAAGRTLGIIGFGHIGREVARRARLGLDMQVIAYSRQEPSDAFADTGVERVSLTDLLVRSDVVTIHVPLNSQTEQLIGRSELTLMKRSAILINTSRGRIVDEGRLAAALKGGRLRGAVLDVFDPEPPPANSPFFALDNVLVTPHMAGTTDDALRRLTIAIAENVRMAIRGERPPNIVNPSAWPRGR
jgi:D-3-phosphoglycerate dehydrogenase / 2-oxoglutarate reductase